MKVTIQPELLSEVTQAELLATLIEGHFGKMFVGTIEAIDMETE